jgi:outer membrane PBP1 activator LpoA protein
MRNQRKPFDQMTAAELRAATKEFDEAFVALEKSRPLSPAQKARHQRAKRRRPGRPKVGAGAARVLISVERGLLKDADAYARRHGLTRAAVVAQGLRSVLRAG